MQLSNLVFKPHYIYVRYCSRICMSILDWRLFILESVVILAVCMRLIKYLTESPKSLWFLGAIIYIYLFYMVSLRKREKQRVALHGNCCHAFLQGRLQCTVDCRVLDHNFISNLFGSFLVWMKNLGRFLFLSLVLSPLKKWFIPKWVRSENSSVFTHACMLGNLKVVRLDIN